MSGFLFAVLPVLFGIVLIGLAERARRRARARAVWASAPGIIETSSVRVRDVKVPLLGRKTLRTTGLTFGDGPRVTYAFEVEGRTWRGTRIGVPPARKGRRRRRAGETWDLTLFEAGRPVTVHYDPADPASCSLYPDEPGRGLVAALWFMGGAFVAFGLMGGWILRGL
ncbi:DUF3592 domain-containing protein [Salinarimonas soli]|uniref:DUF3592 domain-containing protein n=1 Tax=Salinarimonas soli TaxID=1638099 RepID=A0A5B2VD52_9HYPH|nr:DUF3592 domain-containing protein [Salinarimonas soli]KAA2236259.1 DUF3592 domain-containing protein [Salinarimonas soli]